MTTRTPADRLDEAIAGLLAGGRPAVDPELAPLVDAAALVRAALPPLPVGVRFRSRLQSRLVRRRRVGRLLLAGAVSSAAVGATLLAVWLGTRRPPVSAPPVDR